MKHAQVAAGDESETDWFFGDGSDDEAGFESGFYAEEPRVP
jgi:hypothetical protein